MNLKIFSHVFVLRHLKLTDNLGAINSMCQDGYHVGFADLDEISFHDVFEKARMTQRFFDLSTCYIFESSPDHYHLIFLDKGPCGFWIEVMKFMDNERTKKYQRFFVTEDRVCLRITPKGPNQRPVISSIIRRINQRPKSFAHWRFLKHVLSVDVDQLDDSYDRNVKLYLERYRNYEQKKN